MSIIDFLERRFVDSKAIAISYFFCQATDNRLDNAMAVVKGLIFHLLSSNKHRTLIKHLKKEFDTSGPECFTGSNAPYALRRVFSEIIRDETIHGFYFLVDALDECVKGLEDFLRLISLTVSKFDKIRWLVTSRPNIDVRAELSGQSFQRQICLEDNSAHTIDAINIYIRHQVDNLSRKKRYDSDIRAEITSILEGGGAQNTFLWVHLACKELLKTKKRAKHAAQILTNLPSELDELYEKNFTRLLEASDHDEDASLCSHVLAAAFVAVRPLGFHELDLFTDIPEDIDEVQLEELMIEWCELFLVVQNGRITFVHQSAKDFLDHQIGRLGFMPRGKAAEHHRITSKCFQALSKTLKKDICGLKFPGFDTKYLTPKHLKGLPEYDCVFWFRHSALAMTLHDEPQSGSDQSSDGDDSIEHQVLSFLKVHFLHWVEAMIIKGQFLQVVPMICDLEVAVKVWTMPLCP
ncbi:hypothetical protein ABW21_db0200032 [Orbilia brochopaga]|nr:hypothetical protein ABW21_db0200032 [Drechslerella brochopaga]